MTEQFTLTAQTTLVIQSCYTCQILFAMPDELNQRALENRGPHGVEFYCPKGHRQHYVGETDLDRERRRAERMRQQWESTAARLVHEQDQRRATERSNRALRAVNTRTRKRIAKGVCPCCNRTFANLADHMAHQHPGYATTEEATS